MCMQLYAAADSPLPEMPAVTPPHPLSVRPICETEEPVRPHFTKPHVYFLGAHTGCSCGFQYGMGGSEDDEGRASVRALGTYLTLAVASVGPVELFACWEGDEAEPATTSEVVSPEAISGDAERFDLARGWFANVAASTR